MLVRCAFVCQDISLTGVTPFEISTLKRRNLADSLCYIPFYIHIYVYIYKKRKRRNKIVYARLATDFFLLDVEGEGGTRNGGESGMAL